MQNINIKKVLQNAAAGEDFYEGVSSAMKDEDKWKLLKSLGIRNIITRICENNYNFCVSDVPAIVQSVGSQIVNSLPEKMPHYDYVIGICDNLRFVKTALSDKQFIFDCIATNKNVKKAANVVLGVNLSGINAKMLNNTATTYVTALYNTLSLVLSPVPVANIDIDIVLILNAIKNWEDIIIFDRLLRKMDSNLGEWLDELYNYVATANVNTHDRELGIKQIGHQLKELKFNLIDCNL
jgi:hypothetical protein